MNKQNIFSNLIFDNQINRDNAYLRVENDNTILLNTLKCSEIMHHNFLSNNTLKIEENTKLRIRLHLKVLETLNEKCQFTLLLNFFNTNGDKRTEKTNIVFSSNTNECYENYFQSQKNEEELQIAFYINKVMKFDIQIKNFSLEFNSKQISYTDKEIEKILKQDPILYINKLCEAWHEDEAIDTIKESWQRRDSTIIEIFLNSKKVKYSMVVKIWLTVFKYMRNGTVPKKIFINFVLKNLYVFNSSKHKKELENNILNLLIKINDLAFLEESFEKFKILSYENIHIFFKLGILRLTLKTSRDDYLRIKSKFNEFTDIEKLKLYEMDVKSSIVKGITHLELLHRLEEAIISNISYKDLKNKIYNPMNKILTRENCKQLNYFDCRTSNDELIHIYSIIEKSIIEQKPFSLVRFGDGESYILNATDKPLSLIESRNIENALWGRELDDKKRKEVAISSLEAFNNADIVGVFSVYRFIRDIHSNTKSLEGLWKLTRLVEFISKNLKNQIVVEDRIHHLLFDINTIKKFIGISRKVIFITSIHKEKLIKVFGNSVPLEVIETPSEAHMFTNKDFKDRDNKILPDITQDICNELSKAATPGTLVLVASGLAGKQFLMVAKKYGAVALDIGCMADYYIGSKTRSIVELV